MEHIERAGVHSGDSISVYPTQTLSKEVQNKIIDYTIKLGQELNIKGLFNIQFVLDREQNVYVIEVNPRANRTVPILTKVTGIPMVKLATEIMMGKKLQRTWLFHRTCSSLPSHHRKIAGIQLFKIAYGRHFPFSRNEVHGRGYGNRS